MRKTEAAAQFFGMAQRQGMFKPGDDPDGRWKDEIAAGLEQLAMAIADIYDKLEEIDRKLGTERR